MELEFRLEEGDVLAFLDHHGEHSAAAREMRRRQNYGYLFLLAAFALVLWYFGATALAIAILVLGPVWAAWWPARARRLARQQAAAFYPRAPNPMFDGPHVLGLDDAGLVSIVPRTLPDGMAAETRTPFTSVQRIVDTPDYLFIYVSAIQAIVVPRRRVSRGDVIAFAAHLQQRTNARGVHP